MYTTLAGKFVLGAGGSYSGSGGYADASVISHTHGGGTYTAGSNGSHQHTQNAYPSYYDAENVQFNGWAVSTGGNADYNNANVGNNTGSHTHSMSGSSGSASNGVSGTGRNMPPYYVLCWIKKN